MEVYKIRNKDGLFSQGGSNIKWTKKGKTWSSKQALHAHLSSIAGFFDYVGCTLICFTCEGVIEKPIIPLIQELKIRYYEKHKNRYGYYWGYKDEKRESEFIERYEKFKSLKE